MIHGVFQHDVIDDLLLGNPEFLCLLGNLFVDQRSSHEAGTNHVGTDAVLRPLLGNDARQTEQGMLGGDIRRLEFRSLLRVHRSHVDNAAAILLVHLPQRGAGRHATHRSSSKPPTNRRHHESRVSSTHSIVSICVTRSHLASQDSKK